MSESPPDSLIPYDEIVQEALRAVVTADEYAVLAAYFGLPYAFAYFFSALHCRSNRNCPNW